MFGWNSGKKHLNPHIPLSMASAFPSHSSVYTLFHSSPDSTFTLSPPEFAPTDHEAKVSLSVVSIPAAQVSLECQWAQIPSPWLCQCQSAGKRPEQAKYCLYSTALIKLTVGKCCWVFFFLSNYTKREPTVHQQAVENCREEHKLPLSPHCFPHPVL